MQITLVLPVEDVQALLNVVGELQIKTGLHILAEKIKTQAEFQIQRERESKAAPAQPVEQPT